jgi:cytochrome c553
MRWALAVVAGSTALAAITALPVLSQPAGDDPPVPSARGQGSVDVNSGRFLSFGGIYGELRVDCIRCHEIDGSGNSSGAFPRLADQSAWYLYESLLDYAAGLRPSEIMAPIARQLADQEMQNLAAYYASIEDAPYPAESEVDIQILQHGGAIAAVGIPEQGVPACESCHGPNGVGSPPIYPYLAGQFAPYLENQLLLWKAGRRGGDAMNIMELIAKNMTEEQIRAVSLYFASVRSPDITPNEASYLDPEGRPMPRSHDAGRNDMGAVQDPDPGAAAAPPKADPKTETGPLVEPSAALPRRPVPPEVLPPEPSEALDSTTTTTGEQPADQENGPRKPTTPPEQGTGD